MAEDFLSWALSADRNLEERFLVELLLEKGLDSWRIRTGQPHDPGLWQKSRDRKKARMFNPAHRPEIRSADLECALPFILGFETLELGGHDDRPVRDLGGLRFLPALTSLKLTDCELSSLTPLLDLPCLLRFSITGDDELEDYTPLARCTHLQRLNLHPGCAWPELGDLAKLVDLEEFSFGRNPWQLEELGRLACFPKLLTASFALGFPLRDARNLPEMPVLRRLVVREVCRLDGFERFQSLEELTVGGAFRDARPVSGLPKLTHLSFESGTFQDVQPLTQLPELRHFAMCSGWPRDYSPLVEAPKLRQISATGDGARVNEMELATLNAALSPWDEDFALPEQRPWSGPFRLICMDDYASLNAVNAEERVTLDRRENLNFSHAMQQAESAWFHAEVDRITRLTFGQDWEPDGGYTNHACVWIKKVAYAERVPELIEALRELPAKSRVRRMVWIWVTIEQDNWQDSDWEEPSAAAQRYEDDLDLERYKAERLDLLERQYRYDLRKQTEEHIDPEDFSKPLVEPEPVPMPPELLAEDNDDDDDDGEEFDEDASPGIEMDCRIQMDESHVYIMEQDRAVARYLLGREPDEFRHTPKVPTKKPKQPKKKPS